MDRELATDLADEHTHRFLGSVFHCGALQSQEEVSAASRLVSAMGLPWHHDPNKNWDTLKCLLHVLQAADTKSPVLDAGSSRSVIGSWLSLLGYDRLYACDLKKKGRRFFEQYGIEFSSQDLTRTDYPDSFFQAVTCISVIEHNVALPEFCSEMSRILRPGGSLLVSTDYWSDPVDCSGIYPYGDEAGEMRIFSADDLRSLVDLAARHGLELRSAFDPTTRDRAIRWERVDRDYTFAFLAFRRNA